MSDQLKIYRRQAMLWNVLRLGYKSAIAYYVAFWVVNELNNPFALLAAGAAIFFVLFGGFLELQKTFTQRSTYQGGSVAEEKVTIRYW